MKALALTIAMVMAAGCTKIMESRGYIKDPGGYWVKADKPYFGDGKMKKMSPSGMIAYDGSVFTQAMEQNYGNSGPQPVIVVGPDSPAITTASTRGGTTVISTIGSRAPIGRPYAPPIYTPPAYGYYGY